VPPHAIRELRDLTRYRERLVQQHSSGAQRVQKILQDAGVRLGSVASDVPGVSGRAMLRALVAGERRPEVLADLAKGRLRAKLPQLREAMNGRFSAHHAFLARTCLDHIDHLEQAIAALDAEVDEAMAPFAAARGHLDTITGVGKRAAECIIAEMGVDMGRFPTASNLASWGGLCPGNNVTGGKRRSRKTRQGDPWLSAVLVECAWAAARSKDNYLRAQLWRLAKRNSHQPQHHRPMGRPYRSPGGLQALMPTPRSADAPTPAEVLEAGLRRQERPTGSALGAENGRVLSSALEDPGRSVVSALPSQCTRAHRAPNTHNITGGRGRATPLTADEGGAG
jgi:transposase